MAEHRYGSGQKIFLKWHLRSLWALKWNFWIFCIVYSIPKLRLLVKKIISTKTQKDNIFGKTQMEVTPKHFITGVKLEISTRNFDSIGLHVLIKRRASLEGGRVCNHETLKDGPKMTKKIFLLTKRYSFQALNAPCQ